MTHIHLLLNWELPEGRNLAWLVHHYILSPPTMPIMVGAEKMTKS
jgi:hypothetical protein